jgi:Uma2 family endonuclease
MTQARLARRWTRDEFVRAWEAGEFEDKKVELVYGEVWPVSPIHDWHGDTTGKLMRLLWTPDVEVTSMSLASGDSLPDPDCWVRRAGAERSGSLGTRLSTWDPADVLLVVEVSDTSWMRDLQIKARLYGQAGWPVYWVATRKAIYEHTDPHHKGYRHRTEYRRGETIPLPYAGPRLRVDDLLAPDE